MLEKVGTHLFQHFSRLQRIKVFVLALAHAVGVQLVVAVGPEAVAGQAAFHTGQRASVERNDGAA